MYNISTVSNLTGVNSITLRAWERRYGLIQPARSPKGHRLYSDQDIATIHQVLKLMDKGMVLSQINHYLQAPYSDQDLPATPWQTYRDKVLQAVIEFNEQALEQIYNETMSLYSVDQVTRELLIPSIKTLGDRWQNGHIGVGEEHFFAIFMRNKLGSRFHHRNLNNRGPRLLAACLPGEQHELGLLLFSLAAHERDYRIILLGANMPLEELADIATHTQSAGILLSATVIDDEIKLTSQLTQLVKQLKKPVFIGGLIIRNHKHLIDQTGAIATSDDFVDALQIIHQQLKVSKPSGDRP